MRKTEFTTGNVVTLKITEVLEVLIMNTVVLIINLL